MPSGTLQSENISNYVIIRAPNVLGDIMNLSNIFLKFTTTPLDIKTLSIGGELLDQEVLHTFYKFLQQNDLTRLPPEKKSVLDWNLQTLEKINPSGKEQVEKIHQALTGSLEYSFKEAEKKAFNHPEEPEKEKKSLLTIAVDQLLSPCLDALPQDILPPFPLKKKDPFGIYPQATNQILRDGSRRHRSPLFLYHLLRRGSYCFFAVPWMFDQ